MKRSLVHVAAVGAVLLLLMSGCGRNARHERGRPAPVGVTVPSTAPGGVSGGTTPAPGPAGTGDPQLSDVDGLLGQLDGQVKSDDATPGDAD